MNAHVCMFLAYVCVYTHVFVCVRVCVKFTCVCVYVCVYACVCVSDTQRCLRNRSQQKVCEWSVSGSSSKNHTQLDIVS